MKNLDFRKILFKGAFSVMGCDGEIAESEVAEMKEMLFNSPYFEGLDHEMELKAAFEDMKNNGVTSIDNFFSLLQASELSEKQEFQLVEVLIRMVMADNRIDESELHFLHKIKKMLKKLTDNKIIISFPQHINLFLNLIDYQGTDFDKNLNNMDFTALNNLNLKT